ncbi:MAG: AMP-binding protein [Clostridiales bacterium]|nr:AMP-binding protein [Clostridiales bacterium]
MAIYEQFIGMKREAFTSIEDMKKRYKVTYPQDFNFAYDVLDKLAWEKPDKLCMAWVGADGTEKFISFKEMSRMSSKAANCFKSLGIGKGDFVLLVLKRSYMFWYCMMGLHKLGAVAVQATNLLTAKDYIYRNNAASIKMAVITGDGDCTAQFDKGEPYETVQVKAVTKGKKAGAGWIDFDAALDAADDNWERPTGALGTLATDRMLVSFSSGTTGYPKMVSHDFTYSLGHIITGVFWHRVEDGGLHFTISDTGWLKSLWGKMYGQWLGESAVFTYDFDKFNAADILSKLEKYKITTFCAPPTMLRMMANADLASYDLSSLKHVCTAGEALNPDLFFKWKDILGLELHEGFGQTETTLSVATLYPFVKPKPGSMGLPIPNLDFAVIGPDGKEAPPGVTGEIAFHAKDEAQYEGRPCGLFRGYYRNSDATDRVFADGYYHSGDTAYRDEDGYLWYIGRNDDIIKSSGYRIGPFEVESVLAEHPAVLEVAVTGVPDPVRGFNVKATIVPAKGFDPTPELAKELQQHVKTHTAPYKYPRVIEFVSELPKTISGKIKRVEIRQKDMEKNSGQQ